jgi:hypothetical protein
MQSDEKVGSNLLDILLTLSTLRYPNEYDESETPLTDQEICLAGVDTVTVMS